MDPTQLLLGVLTVATGGSFVQLIVYLLRRRGEIKTEDAKAKEFSASADSTLLDSATAYAAQLQATVTGQASMADKLNGRIDHLEAALDAEQEKSARNAGIANDEIRRLSSKVAELTTNLAIALNRVELLSQELAAVRGRHRPV